MGQLNIYAPDELEEKIKKEAQKEGKSVSAFVLEAVKNRIEPKAWSQEFLATFGSVGADFPDDIEDLPQQERDFHEISS
ncbi:ribbon-helix-helix domain-containing protein [Bdellovibrionota bacterium FG-2]